MTHRDSAPNTPRDSAVTPAEAPEAATTEDKVVSQLSGRRWDQSPLAGPRENFYGGVPPTDGQGTAPLLEAPQPASATPRQSGQVVRRSQYQDPIRPRRGSSKNPYGHVKSVVAEYRRGTITDAEARYGLMNSPTQDSLDATPTNRRASMHPDQRQGRPSSATRRKSSAPAVPRCASVIPDRYKYVPKPVKTPEEIEEEKRQKEAEERKTKEEAEAEEKKRNRPTRKSRGRSHSKRGRSTTRRTVGETAAPAADPKQELLRKYKLVEEQEAERPSADQLYPLREGDVVPESPPSAGPSPLSVYRSKLVFDMAPPVLVDK
ncbi:splicing factor, arginine/serine-rich 12 [Angomonas deanei]|nr:splicing factor, arginine/serine-rich 12 [Angomonas deanei]|eukprot:EPY19590.1 splicing factor, arginine/serine-rich 12 [Angomonas deanei]